MTFKVGDTVRVTGYPDSYGNALVVRETGIYGSEYERGVRFENLKGYDDADDYHNVHVSEMQYVKVVEAVNPNHYKFPGGIEVRQISAHLTSFGGQALQYIARATRLDGNNKGEAVEDLEKAIRLIQWEIERIKADG